MIRLTARWGLTVCLAALALAPLRAQDTRGQILGRITDHSGAVVVNAQVRATNTDTNVTVNATTGDTGDFVLPYLIPGPYTLAVDAAGFKTYVREGLALQSSSRLALNVSLDIGTQAETVKVTAEASLLDTSTASIGATMSNRNIMDLPLKDGMVLIMATYVPGVVYLSGGEGYIRPFDTGNPSSISVDGTRSGSNQFLLDGAPNMQGTSVAYSPPPGMVSEFQIQNTTFDAAYGYYTGAALNLSLKTGTNGLHGQGYLFIQNPVFNATDFFVNSVPGFRKTIFRSARWGGNASGPVYLPKIYDGRNKTFWMYGYEGMHSLAATPYAIQSQPTPAERLGDFSALLALGSRYQIYDPLSATPTGTGLLNRKPLPNNVIPPSQINPVARNIVGLFDLPNQPGGPDGSNNNIQPQNELDYYFNHLVRIDQNVSDKERFFVRTNFTRMNRTQNFRDNDATGYRFLRYNRGAAFSNVYTFSPRFFVEARYSYTRFLGGYAAGQQGWDLASLGFSSQFLSQINAVSPIGQLPSYSTSPGPAFPRAGQLQATTLKMPDINIASFDELSSQTTTMTFYDTHNVAINFTDLVGAHALHFGFGLLERRVNSFDLGQSSGSFNFDSTWTSGPTSTSAASPLGQSMAAFLYGLPTTGYFPRNNSYAEASPTWATYITDDWKLTSRLTVSAGLRWELEQPMTERYNRSVLGFDSKAPLPISSQVLANYTANPVSAVPATRFNTLGGLTYAGVNGQPRQLWNTYKKAIMPRLSVAYNLNSKTVLRAGYGIFYEPRGGASVNVNLTGFNYNTLYVPTLNAGETFVANLTNPFPNGITPPPGASRGAATNLGQTITFFNQNQKQPYMQRWQFAVQRELAAGSIVEVSYVGNRGTRQLISQQLDAVPNSYLSTSPARDQAAINYLNTQVPNPYYPLLPGTSLSGATVPQSQLLRPFPQFTGVTYNSNQGYSWYHALQTRVEKRVSNDYTMTVGWTWSKLMQATSYLNPGDAAPTKVISDQDRPQRFTVTGIYELPFGPGKRFGASAPAALRKMIGGWQVEGIYAYQTGQALGFGNFLLLPGQTLQDIPLPKDKRTPNQWFNINAFNRVSSQQLGSNLITNSIAFNGIRSDGQNNLDLSFMKNTTIRENVRVQFRAEAVNAANHPQFSSPDTNPVSSTFGRVTGAGSAVGGTWSWARLIQFGVKVLF